MPLHHRPEISNMRDAYEHDHQVHGHYTPDSNSDRSYRSESFKSPSTPPTSTSGSSARQSPIVHNQKPRDRNEDARDQSITDGIRCTSPVSTVDSEDDLEDDIPEYDPPEYTSDRYEPSAIPARPADFSELFPSNRRLDIRHDDSTPDGNMNLRVDTKVTIHDREYNMTLFHLRMHDLRNREFSLRRYCRDSGREVCHSIRKHQKSGAERRPGFQRSLSNALHSMRPKLEPRSSTGPATTSLERHDSGYGSMHSSDEECRPTSSGSDAAGHEQPLTNSIKLEFSNYAQMDVNLSKDKKRYEFDYWNKKYAWKRILDKRSNEVEFELIDREASSKKVLSRIKPIPLTAREADEERYNGGWIPQCLMEITDKSTLAAAKDISDAIVAAGLMALVDDSIRSHFHSEESKLLLIPTSIGPTRLINEMFSRKDSKFDSQSGHAFNDGQSKASRVTAGSVRPSSRDH